MIGLYSLFGTKKQVIIFLEVKKNDEFSTAKKNSFQADETKKLISSIAHVRNEC